MKEPTEQTVCGVKQVQAGTREGWTRLYDMCFKRTIGSRFSILGEWPKQCLIKWLEFIQQRKFEIWRLLNSGNSHKNVLMIWIIQTFDLKRVVISDMVNSHICFRLHTMADCQIWSTETQIWIHQIEKWSERLERAEFELFGELLLKVLALSQAELWCYWVKKSALCSF